MYARKRVCAYIYIGMFIIHLNIHFLFYIHIPAWNLRVYMCTYEGMRYWRICMYFLDSQLINYSSAPDCSNRSNYCEIYISNRHLKTIHPAARTRTCLATAHTHERIYWQISSLPSQGYVHARRHRHKRACARAPQPRRAKVCLENSRPSFRVPRRGRNLQCYGSIA